MKGGPAGVGCLSPPRITYVFGRKHPVEPNGAGSRLTWTLMRIEGPFEIQRSVLEAGSDD